MDLADRDILWPEQPDHDEHHNTDSEHSEEDRRERPAVKERQAGRSAGRWLERQLEAG